MRLAPFVLAWILLLPAVAAAPYLQSGADAARSGLVVDAGPDSFDIAYDVTGAMSPAILAGPVILDRSVYILGSSAEGTGAIWRLDLDTANLAPWFAITGTYPHGLVSDGEQLFFTTVGEIQGVRLADGSSWRTPINTEFGPVRRCAEPAVTDVLILVCEVSEASPAENGVVNTNFINPTSRPLYLRLDLDGTVLASRFIDLPAPEDLLFEESTDLIRVQSVAAEGNMTYIGIEGGEAARPRVLALTETGEIAWSYAFEPFESPVVGRLANDVQDSYYSNTYVAVVGQNLVAVANHIAVLERDGSVVREMFFPRSDEQRLMEAGSPAHSAGRVYVPIRGGVTAFTMSGQSLWDAPGSHDWQLRSSTLLAGGKLYRINWNTELVAYSLDGEQIWSQQAPSAGGSRSGFGIGDNVLVQYADPTDCGDTTDVAICPTVLWMRVHGQTAVSIQLEAKVNTWYPAVGGALELDLGDTLPGFQSPDVNYLVRWGDGEESTGGPTLSHRYREAGDHVVDILAFNEAGQESSTSMIIHVGAQAPNLISEAFSPENQESTFFTLGLILTLLFAGFGALRLRRKRRTLRKELAKADAVVVAAKDDPDQLREQLRDHRSNARRLFLDGRLDEGSTGILERHIDELLRDHRLSNVEADLAFLPHGLFRSMQEMLRDARVTQLERNNFLAALSDDKHLTPGEKKRVQRHVENWHREDAA